MKWKIDIYSLLEGFDWIALKKCLPQSILEEHWWGVFIVNASLQSLMFVHGIGISYLCCTVHVNICLWYRFKTILVPLRRHSHVGVWDLFNNNDDTIKNKFCWYESGSDWSFHIISSSSIFYSNRFQIVCSYLCNMKKGLPYSHVMKVLLLEIVVTSLSRTSQLVSVLYWTMW